MRTTAQCLLLSTAAARARMHTPRASKARGTARTRYTLHAQATAAVDSVHSVREAHAGEGLLQVGDRSVHPRHARLVVPCHAACAAGGFRRAVQVVAQVEQRLSERLALPVPPLTLRHHRAGRALVGRRHLSRGNPNGHLLAAIGNCAGDLLVPMTDGTSKVIETGERRGAPAQLLGRAQRANDLGGGRAQAQLKAACVPYTCADGR